MTSSPFRLLRRAPAIVLLATAPGCSDYTLGEYKGGYDTAGDMGDTPLVEVLDSSSTTGGLATAK